MLEGMCKIIWQDGGPASLVLILIENINQYSILSKYTVESTDFYPLVSLSGSVVHVESNMSSHSKL